MKKNNVITVFSILSLIYLFVCFSCTDGRKITRNEPDTMEERLGWKLGSQAYTFRGFTFSETLRKIDSCGLKYVEAFPNQQIGNGIQGTMNFHMDKETRAIVKKMLDDSGIKMNAYGVVKASGAVEWRKVFEFCQDMGVQTITCEPVDKDLDIVSSLCDSFQMNAAIHNHPAPTSYWNPDAVLKAIKGRSIRMGACADIGHWVRSGLDPIECLRKLTGHIKHFHFKDINQIEDRKESEVIWGSGLCNVPGVMREMKSQHFKGMISVEYEHNLNNNIKPVINSVAYFRNELSKYEQKAVN